MRPALAIARNMSVDDAEWMAVNIEMAARRAKVALTMADSCAFCGSPKAEHEPSGCCGDGGGSTFASGMSASGQDPQGLEAKPASPTREAGDAQ